MRNFMVLSWFWDEGVNGIASQVAQRVSGLSIEQMGGVGFTRELGIEKYWRYKSLYELH